MTAPTGRHIAIACKLAENGSQIGYFRKSQQWACYRPQERDAPPPKGTFAVGLDADGKNPGRKAMLDGAEAASKPQDEDTVL